MANEYVIDCEKFRFRDEKFIDQMAQFLEERIPDSSVKISGNIINMAVPEKVSKKMLKIRANKFLYQSGLKKDYRLVSLVKSKAGEGFMVVEF